MVVYQKRYEEYVWAVYMKDDNNKKQLLVDREGNVDSIKSVFPHSLCEYNGDRGIHRVQISENMSVPTSLDGLTVFGRVETANGRRNIFEIIDGVAASINPLRELNEHATADVRAEAIFTLPRQNHSQTR